MSRPSRWQVRNNLLQKWVGSKVWPNAADCKSALEEYVGSNPTLPTIFWSRQIGKVNGL